MILSQISYLDCIVFLIFLVPQLLIHVGLIRTTTWLIGALPSLSESTTFASSPDIYIHSLASLYFALPVRPGKIFHTL
jgi:hypothetical protein